VYSSTWSPRFALSGRWGGKSLQTEATCRTAVGGSVDAGMETSVESGLSIRLLGALSVHRDGAPLELPRSRKVRALLGFLALTPEPVGRSRLCDLLWEVPNDPRGELRWCLSRLRSVLGPDNHRLTTPASDQVVLDTAGCFVDALAVDRALQAGIDRMET